MGTCPHCQTSSRVDPDSFTVDTVLVVKPPGSFSLAGATLKASAYERVRIRHSCGWTATGYIDGGDLVVETSEVRDGDVELPADPAE